MKTFCMIVLMVVLNVVSVNAKDITPVNTPALEDISVPKEGIWAMDIYTGRVYVNHVIDAYYSSCNGVVRVLNIDDEAQSFVATEYLYDKVKLFNANGECGVMSDGNFVCP